MNIIKQQEIENDDTDKFLVSIVFTRNNLEESRAWRFRTGSSKIRTAKQFSSKKDADINSYEDMSSEFLEAKT